MTDRERFPCRCLSIVNHKSEIGNPSVLFPKFRRFPPMFVRLVSASLLAVAFLCLAGCGPAKLNQSRTWADFDVGDARAIDLDPQSKPQTITVEFSVGEGEVTALVVKKDDAKTDDDLLSVPASKAIA